jgi:tetratricopeptide (TPR) repeat protein
VAHNDIGRAFSSQGKLIEALAEFRKGLAIAEHLATTDPSRAQWQHDLAASYGLIGDVLIAKEDIQDAIKSYQRRGAILERLVASDPRNSFW